MAIEINTYHGTRNRAERSSLSAIKYPVVHYTGGTGSAKNNCIYFASGDRKASADYFIDKDGSIWEYNNPKQGYYTYHCGDGKGKYGVTNANSIGIEVVSNGEAFTAAQIKALNELLAYLKSVYKFTGDVQRHYDASRKHCPAPYVKADKWKTLKGKIAPSASKPAASSTSKGTKYRVTTASGVYVRKDARKSSAVVSAKAKGATVTVYNTKKEGTRTWGRIGTQKWICLKEGSKAYAKKC